MSSAQDYLTLSDEELLAQCDVDVYKSSGPGGQHRNKVSSAVRLRHGPTGLSVHGDESRSQHQNKRAALRRLRMNIACRLRERVDTEAGRVPDVVAECTFVPRRKLSGPARRLAVGRKDPRFWPVAAFLLDVLEAFEGRLADAARYVGITTGNFTALLKTERHILQSAQLIRKTHGRPPIR